MKKGVRVKQVRKFACDFETTTESYSRTETKVWSAAWCEIGSEEVFVRGSISEMLMYFKTVVRDDCMLYFHNLKFDGEFIIYHLLSRGYRCITDKDEKLTSKTFRVLISTKGSWYKITLKTGRQEIEIRDSLKLLPFTLRKIGESFKTKHQKLDMDYSSCTNIKDATKEQIDYIKNDVLVLSEALQITFQEGHDGLTIGSCCLNEYKEVSGYDKKLWEEHFPNLYDIKINENIYGAPSAGDFILKAYHGGWCYRVGHEQIVCNHKGITVDANSLYPSQMLGSSGNRYPIGKPVFWYGDYIPDEAKAADRFYYVKFRCRFYLKEGKLPFVHIRKNPFYHANENLESSDIVINGEHFTRVKDNYGNEVEYVPELTMTMMDYKLFLEQYDVLNFEIIGGCWFYTEIGLFDKYIEKWRKIKETSKGAIRTIAKLYMNNLYGKFAATVDSSYKIPYLEGGIVKYDPVTASDKLPGYIAIGAAITSYAACTTIRAAQANYNGVDQPGFKYADTDSLHCDYESEEQLIGVPIHDTKLLYWKVESHWDKAVFTRQKTYIEHDEDGYHITCAGLPEVCKEIISDWLDNKLISLRDFAPGLSVKGKLFPTRVEGGILLMEGEFTMH